MFKLTVTLPRRLAVLACMLLALLAACQTAPESSDWLYHQLGEREGISRLNETFILNIARDDRISGIFEDVDITRLHRLFTEQFCVLAGGPCSYTGRTMYDAHDDLGLTSTDFNAVVEDLVKAMETEGISVSAQNRLLAQLAPMRHDIVGTEPPPPIAADADPSGVGDVPQSGYSATP